MMNFAIEAFLFGNCPLDFNKTLEEKKSKTSKQNYKEKKIP